MQLISKVASIFIVIMALTIVVVMPQTRAQSDSHLSEINAYLDDLAAKGFSGVVLLTKDGKPVVRRSFPDKSGSTTADAGYDIGSITKVFTSAAIFRLEQDGELKITDRIEKYFKDVPANKREITIYQLVTHTYGLPDLLGPGGKLVKDYTGEYDFENVSRKEIIHRAMASKLLFAPGTATKYSNTGYSLLAAIIEIASRKKYERYVHDAVFVPANMEHTGYLLPKWKKEKLAVGYVRGASWGTPLDHRWLKDGPSWNLRGNGGMISTVDDILIWTRALIGDRVLSATEKESYFTAMNVKKNKRGVRTMGAAGSNDVFTSVYLWVLDEDRLVVIFSNNDKFSAEQYAGTLAGMMLRAGI